jgi:hypothetical protein
MVILSKDISSKKFGKLRIKVPKDIMSGSRKKILWICDCGKEKLISIYNVLSGNITSCNNCNLISAADIATKKFGKLRIKTPQDIKSRSDKKILWICDCGKEKLVKIGYVLSNQITSCGQCNLISAADIATKKFSKLRIKIPQDIKPKSDKKILWICNCGREKLIRISNVFSGNTISCGQCSQISAAEIASKKFGKLRIKIPQDIKPGSAKKIEWICDCGKEIIKQISLVISGNTSSCGQCGELIKNWYIQNREQIRSLKCPIDSKDFIPGGMIPLETIKKTKNSFKAICPACKGIYYPYLYSIKLGKSLTCGCSTYRISMPVIEITEYIRSLGFEVQNEYKINKLYYDIFIPQKNLLIEFQGIRWHSMKGMKERDMRKKQNAINSGYQFMEILEKDWKIKKNELKLSIQSRNFPLTNVI